MRAAGSTIVGIGLALVVAGCGDSGSAEVTTTRAAETTISLATTTTSEVTTTTTEQPSEPTALRDVEGGTQSGLGWLAEAGVYEAFVDGRTLTLDMPEPFTYIPRRNELLIAPAEVGPGIRIPVIAFAGLDGVVAPDQVGVQHDESTIGDATEPAPDDIATWLEAVSQLETTGLGPIDGEGWDAAVWDLTVNPEAGDTFSCPWGRCIESLVTTENSVYTIGDEFAFRLWQFGGAGQGLYALAQAPPDEADAALDFFDRVLDGLTIE